MKSVGKAMAAFNPTDEIEGMIAAQADAQHHAAMESSRRAVIPDQGFEAGREYRKAAVNASRAFVELVSALDRKRGKGGRQKVTVEHVHVHAGGKASSEPSGRQSPETGAGEGQRKDLGKNPMHRLPHWATTLPLAQSSPRCGARTRGGTPCQSPAMPNGRCRMHGGASAGPRTADGIGRIRKARMKHGLYSAEMARMRGACAEMQRLARLVLEKV
jgi:hypothetical protein